MKIAAALCLTLLAGAAIACNSAEAPAAPEPTPTRVPPPLWADPSPPFDAEQVSYLETVVEPCVPLEGFPHNPCAIRAWSLPYFVDYVHPDQTTSFDKNVQVDAVPALPTPATELERLRNWFEIVAESTGYGNSRRVPHIIARGVFLPGSTRCVFHELPRVRIGCYIDFRVREYIVGRGPEILTMRPLSAVRYFSQNHELYKTEDYQKRLSEHVSKRWEGGEVVAYLGLDDFNRAVEVWRMVEFDGVRRLRDGRIVADGRELGQFTSDMRSAHATVIAEHEFELVNDANLKYLREHLQGRGYYEEFGEFISPPPPPFTE